MASTHLPYSHMLVPFVMAGAGMALVFAPSANAVLASVRTEQAGQASGANNAIREVGGVFGVAVLASIFTGAGGYASPQAFVNGLIPALWVGVGGARRGRARRARAPVPHAGAAMRRSPADPPGARPTCGDVREPPMSAALAAWRDRRPTERSRGARGRGERRARPCPRPRAGGSRPPSAARS